LKFAEAIRKVVSTAIFTEMKDPRVSGVTVTLVEVSGDLRQAKIHVSVMGDDTRQRLCLSGLKSAAGFLQAKLAEELDARYTPRIEFVLDKGIKNSLEVARILREVLPASNPSPGPSVSEDDSDSDDSDADDSDFDDSDADDSDADDSSSSAAGSAAHDPDATVHDPDAAADRNASPAARDIVN